MNALAIFLALYTQAEITRLGNDAWHEREAASQRLAALMPMTDHALAQVAGCPERVWRGRRIRDEWAGSQGPWYFARAQALRAPGFRVTPWVDSLGGVSCSFWLARAEAHPEKANLPKRTYEVYRLATVLWAADQLQCGASEADILAVYAQGVLYEIAWLERTGNGEWKKLLAEVRE